MDFLLNMLSENEKNSTPVNTEDSNDLVFERDEQGTLWSYNKKTGEKVGRIFEHGNNAKNNVAKTFSEIIRRE